jgi:kynurenine formamidase
VYYTGSNTELKNVQTSACQTPTLMGAPPSSAAADAKAERRVMATGTSTAVAGESPTPAQTALLLVVDHAHLLLTCIFVAHRSLLLLNICPVEQLCNNDR